MIFFIFGKTAQGRLAIPAVGFTVKKDTGYERFITRDAADYIFTFEAGKTVYLKNRHGALSGGYQYTEDEQIIIRLKAAPI
jgi:hypothetical protein